MPFEQLEQFDRRGETEGQNNDARKGSPNDMNGMNGILHNSVDPVVQNTTNIDVPNETDNNPNLNVY